MKSSYFILLLFILPACQGDKYDDKNKRNSDWVWFIPIGSEKGEWKKLGYDSNDPLLSGGSVTSFYNNGNTRETYTVDQNGEYDTIMFYDTAGNLTHYSTDLSGAYSHYIFRDGPFKAFSYSGELIFSGTATNHKLSDYEFKGSLKSFNELLHLYKSCDSLSDNYLKLALISVNKIKEGASDSITLQIIRSLDSIRQVSIIQMSEVLRSTKNMKPLENQTAIFKETILYVEACIDAFEKELKQVNSYLEKGWTENTRLLSYGLLNNFKMKISDAENSLVDEQISYTRKEHISDFYAEFFDDFYRDF